MTGDTEVLPQGWETIALGLICDLINGDRGKNYPGRKALVKEGIPFVNAGNLQDGQISIERLGYVASSTFDLLRSGKFGIGDILYCIRGSLGKAALNTRLPIGGIASSLIIVRPDSRISQEYIYYYLSSPLAHRMIQRFDNGTAQPNLSGADLAKFQVPLPGLRTQERIVAKIEELLSELDKGVEALTTAREQLKAYRQVLLTQAYKGGLSKNWRERNRPAASVVDQLISCVPPSRLKGLELLASIDMAELPTLPAEWRYARLGYFIDQIDAGKSFKCDERKPEANEIGVAKVSAVTWGEYDEEESKTCIDSAKVNPHYFIREGDFLFSRANTIELVGACVIAKKVTRKVMLSDKTLRVAFADFLPAYLLHYLRSPLGRKEIMSRSTGNQESMRNIGQDRIRNIVVPLCSRDEAAFIEQRLQEAFSAIDNLEDEINGQLVKADALRQSILKQAFSGHLVAQCPNDEPASTLSEPIRAERAGATTKKSRNGKNGKNGKKKAA